MIEILSSATANSVQDLGREQYREIGVSQGGAMDREALMLANQMVGNSPGAAGIEVCLFPFRLRVETPIRVACTGADTTLSVSHSGSDLAQDRQAFASWWSFQAQAGDVLTVMPPVQGARVYLAFEGGLDVPELLGSRATDLKSRFGGHKGRGLKKGDRIPVIEPAERLAHQRPFGLLVPMRRQLARELAQEALSIRAVPGAEFERFTQASRRQFCRALYRLTPASNRQGCRLEGAPLTTTRPFELLSHGLVTGTIQVPPGGQPIIQLAEANTCGGYPKIATVIESDLWRLAQVRPGQAIRFEVVDLEQGMSLLSAHEAEMAMLGASLASRLQR